MHSKSKAKIFQALRHQRPNTNTKQMHEFYILMHQKNSYSSNSKAHKNSITLSHSNSKTRLLFKNSFFHPKLKSKSIITHIIKNALGRTKHSNDLLPCVVQQMHCETGMCVEKLSTHCVTSFHRHVNPLHRLVKYIVRICRIP